MLIARYRHRLPADYPMDRIRARVAERASAWDAIAGLVFKAVTIEDRARGAAANAYSSLYLWQDADAAVDFLGAPGFRAVVEGFGRPRVDIWLAFAVAFGTAATGHVVSEETRPTASDADLGTLRVREQARGREIAGQSGVLASMAGLDTAQWRLTRFTLRTEPAADTAGAEIAHVAGPGLAAARQS